MYRINFKNPVHVYFMGIGGISMSGFAELLHCSGFRVSGSDAKESGITKHLEDVGISVLYGQRAENITDDIELVVYTAAIHPDNPEFMAAKAAGIPMMDRAEMVGQVMKNYERAIAVSGTHGKTTTTSMLSHLLLAAQMDPTISVGGILKAINGNIRIGKSQNFITEACEYTNSFLKFSPTIGVILNIEAEHLDFFKDLEDIRNSFRRFAGLLPEQGVLVISRDIENWRDITKDCRCRTVTSSIRHLDADYAADEISFNEVGQGVYTLVRRGERLGRVELKVVGEHNIANSLAAVAVAMELGISLDQIRQGLSEFYGTDRRFQYKGEVNGITVIDDYAHHPTEIKATLKAAANYPRNQLWCVFQPHTYSRTKAFLHEFADALALADKIVLTDIYSARESDPGDISARDLAAELEKKGKEVFYFPSFGEVEAFLLKKCTHGDLLITMGAGDVVNIGEALISK